MLLITISAPTGGRTVAATRGQLTPYVVRGTFRSDDDPSPRITVTWFGKNVIAGIDPNTQTWQATIELECPSRTAVQANIEAWVPSPSGHGQRHLESRSASPLYLRVRDPQSDPAYEVQGTVVDNRNVPVPGVLVTVFDRDSRSRADRLGSARADDDGHFTIRFVESAFTELPAERGPDLVFTAESASGDRLTAFVVGARGGWLPNADQSPTPFLLQVSPVNGFDLSSEVRKKWRSLGGSAGQLGLPTGDELPLPNGRGGIANFRGGLIIRLVEFTSTVVLYGLILARWRALGAEASWLGLPVSDEIADPVAPGARASVFEHGVIRWRPGQAAAIESGHDFARLHGQLRARLLARFFALGRGGRRNWLSKWNRLEAMPPEVSANADANEASRWRIEEHGSENPFLDGVPLIAAMAVEQAEGNATSARVLSDWLATTNSLCTWTNEGPGGRGRLPQRWDAGTYLDAGNPEQRFFPRGGSWAGAIPTNDIHHAPIRLRATMDALLGPREGLKYAGDGPDNWGFAKNHAMRYRVWELSMDELVGLVTSYWLIARLCTDATIRNEVRRQATWVGNYLADHGYWLIRPQGGLSWRGATGQLPAMEHPIARALAFAAGNGADFRCRINLQTALERTGHWEQLAGPIGTYQILSWAAFLASLAGPAVAGAVSLTVEGLSLAFAGQFLSPSTLGAALALYLHRDVFDVNEREEVALGALSLGSADKRGLYRNFTLAQAVIVNLAGSRKAWSVAFPGTLGLTGLDDVDPIVAQTFTDWYNIRQAKLDLEPKSFGSRTLFAAGVAALLGVSPDADAKLLARLDRAVVELFRDCYFDPQPWVGRFDADNSGEHPHECALLPWFLYQPEGSTPAPSTPYGPLDFLGAHALACWHAKRQADAGTPITISRFPAPLSRAVMDTWPEPGVLASSLSTLEAQGIPVADIQGTPSPSILRGGVHPVFAGPVVRRRPTPTPQSPATQLLWDSSVTVPALPPGEVATGITVYPGQELQIEARGRIRSGRLLDPENGPEGLQRRVFDARWPLHVGIDPDAMEMCLLGRLNGWFRIGEHLSRRRWLYHEKRALFLRINDGDPQRSATGEYLVRIRVFGPASPDPPVVFRPPNVLGDGGVLYTIDARDLIEVTVTPGGADPTMVVFELATPPTMTWRKELVIREGSQAGIGEWTVVTENAVHLGENALYESQLRGATLAFRKQVPLAMSQVRLLDGLELVPLGTRIRFEWVRD